MVLGLIFLRTDMYKVKPEKLGRTLKYCIIRDDGSVCDWFDHECDALARLDFLKLMGWAGK